MCRHKDALWYSTRFRFKHAVPTQLLPWCSTWKAIARRWCWVCLRHHLRSTTSRMLLSMHTLLMLVERWSLRTRHSWPIIRMSWGIARSTVKIVPIPCCVTWAVIHCCVCLSHWQNQKHTAAGTSITGTQLTLCHDIMSNTTEMPVYF